MSKIRIFVTRPNMTRRRCSSHGNQLVFLLPWKQFIFFGTKQNKLLNELDKTLRGCWTHFLTDWNRRLRSSHGELLFVAAIWLLHMFKSHGSTMQQHGWYGGLACPSYHYHIIYTSREFSLSIDCLRIPRIRRTSKNICTVRLGMCELHILLHCTE